MSKASHLIIYYDGQCPFCTRYTSLLRLREQVGAVDLVDLRTTPNARRQFEAAGISLDKGMVVDYQGRFWHGSDAMHLLASLSGEVGVFNRINRLLFSRVWLATFLYPLLRMGRNTVLLLLARPPLHQTQADGDHFFRIFTVGWGVFACLHLAVYLTQFQVQPFPSTFLIGFIGFLLLLFPGEKRLFLGLATVMVIDAALHAPLYSNHTILKNFFLLALLFGGLYHALRATIGTRSSKASHPLAGHCW